MLAELRNRVTSLGVAALFVMVLGLSFCATAVRAQDTAKSSGDATVAQADAAAKPVPRVVAPAEPVATPSAAKYDTGSIAWLMVSAALVFL